ncbi:MAG TPA: hypothetical protein VJ201_00985, partial [Candidatus Babeliales bacterium]|nr:hypothetical protein [Candidatus Babeliales bacterium]
MDSIKKMALYYLEVLTFKILGVLFLLAFAVDTNAYFETTLPDNSLRQSITLYEYTNDSNEDRKFYSRQSYKHRSNLNFGFFEPLGQYSNQQLRLYFEKSGCSEKEILNQRHLYFSEDFVKLAKTYPGYAVTIKALHKQFESTSRTKKLVDILWSGKYRAGLQKRINQLYHEISSKNPILLKPILSPNQCNEYRELQQLYSQDFPCLSQAIKKRFQAIAELQRGKEHFSTQPYHIDSNVSQLLLKNNYYPAGFIECIGNQLQHVIHQESIDILQYLSILSPLLILYSYQSGLVDCVAAIRDYNEQGFIDNAVSIADFCWTLLDCGQAVAEGVALGLYATAQDFVDHPVMTTAIAIVGKPVLIYQLCKIVYNVAEIGITTLINPDKGKNKWDNYIQPLTQLISEIENKNITVRDCIK